MRLGSNSCTAGGPRDPSYPQSHGPLAAQDSVSDGECLGFLPAREDGHTHDPEGCLVLDWLQQNN